MITPDYFTNQLVRDLAWIFTSPSIIEIDTLSFEQTRLSFDWLKKLDDAPGAIIDFMADKNMKMLGPYFEALWEFYFLHYPGKSLITKNLQVFDANNTIGEFDFIYYNEMTNEHCHLEVAIKYYLGLNVNLENAEAQLNLSPMQYWLGPNANDRLDKKTTKMLEHQSRLSRTSAGVKALEKLNIEKVKSEVCMLGTLFYPMCGKIQAPEHTRATHNKGYWLRCSQLDEYLPADNLWLPLEKPHWMAPVIRQNNDLYVHDEMVNIIRSHFSTSSRPLLIANFKPVEQLNSRLFSSAGKYFIVPESWPLNIY